MLNSLETSACLHLPSALSDNKSLCHFSCCDCPGCATSHSSSSSFSTSTPMTPIMSSIPSDDYQLLSVKLGQWLASELFEEEYSARSSGCSSMSSGQQSVASQRERLQSLCLTPSPCMLWALEMRYLLEDAEGVQLFKQFVEQESVSSAVNCLQTAASLDFWFACQGFKNNILCTDNQKIYQLIKIIYRTYVRGDMALDSITQPTRRRIGDKLAQKRALDQSIFDEAQHEVKQWMRGSSYVAFLKSDLFAQYVASEVKTTCSDFLSTFDELTSTRSVPSATTKPNEDDTCISAVPALKRRHLNKTRQERDPFRGGKTPAGLLHSSPHAAISSLTYDSVLSELPVTPSATADGPRGMSMPPMSMPPMPLMSSDNTQTNYGNSHTDLSILNVDDNVTARGHVRRDKQWRLQQQRRALRQSTLQKREVASSASAQLAAPSTKTKQSKCGNLAEQNPREFARVLHDKLKGLLVEQANVQRMNQLLLLDQDNNVEDDRCSADDGGAVAKSAVLRAPWAGRLLAAAQQATKMQDAQTILEDHCDRIWKKSVEIKSMEIVTQSSISRNAPALDNHNNIDKEFHFIHHYHYHHYPPLCDAMRALTAEDMSSGELTTALPGQHKLTEAPSDVDSGVTMTYDQINSSNSKVMAWISASSQQQSHQLPSKVLDVHETVDHSSNSILFPCFTCSTATLFSASDSHQMPIQNKLHPHVNQKTVAHNSNGTSLTCSTCSAANVISRSDPHWLPIVQLDDTKQRVNPQSVNRETSLSNTSMSSTCGCTVFSTRVSSQNLITVGYYLCGDPVPYRYTWQGEHITLAEFKQLVAKKGSYKYFFKTLCNDFETGVAHQEISVDDDVLPLWEGKVVGIIEHLDV